MPQLVTEIFEREAIAGERLGGEVLSFFLIDLRLCFFDQRQDVAHAQNARHDAVGMKGFERVIFFADADEFDGLPRDLADGKRRAATGVAIHFGENDAGERELFMELICGFHRILAGHGVGNE